MSPIFFVALLATATVLPKSAEIVDSLRPTAPFPFGNVLVTFTDGHKEKWTRRGQAMTPHVSSTGLVGWIVITGRNERGGLKLHTLRVCWPDGHHRDFLSDLPTIEKWDFTADGLAVIFRSRGAHGPEDYEEYDLNGKLLNEAHTHLDQDLPAWAQPFSN